MFSTCLRFSTFGDIAEQAYHVIEVGWAAGRCRVQRQSHGGDVLRRSAAASADDTRAGITRHDSIVRHDFGCTVIDDFIVNKFGDTAVCLGDYDRIATIGG